MPILPLSAAALALSVPSAGGSLKYTDYPEWALRAEASAASLVSLSLTPGGKLFACRSEQELGDPRLAGDICSLLRGRRFPHATLRDGTASYARVQELIRLFLPDTSDGGRIASLRASPNAEFQVKSLNGQPSADVDVVLAVNANGSITDCGPKSGGTSALIKAACSQSSSFQVPAMTDESGRAVPFVTNWRVRFSVPPPRLSK
ncbi:hypothetical protein OMW55_03095 [Sphingomonas sp. BN140010]|uniref:TonB C-terminal domain-containing protein n=1 Tax=Sphingomonas arvum TaxID=2992113 RepID=A0ABT3JCI7_9SPHN|nr:hypothetical protein [Sphingomonas sp. BN140010]MCW3796791.1 hypothetical protein [Sphingomonas sp. BN140010]